MKIGAIIKAYTLEAKTKVYPERWVEVSMRDINDYIWFGQQSKYKLQIIAYDYADEPTDIVLVSRDIDEIKKGTSYNINFMGNTFCYNSITEDIVCLNRIINI